MLTLRLVVVSTYQLFFVFFSVSIRKVLLQHLTCRTCFQCQAFKCWGRKSLCTLSRKCFDVEWRSLWNEWLWVENLNPWNAYGLTKNCCCSHAGFQFQGSKMPFWESFQEHFAISSLQIKYVMLLFLLSRVENSWKKLSNRCLKWFRLKARHGAFVVQYVVTSSRKFPEACKFL